MSAQLTTTSRPFFPVVWAGVAYLLAVIACVALFVGGHRALWILGLFSVAALVVCAGVRAIASIIP